MIGLRQSRCCKVPGRAGPQAAGLAAPASFTGRDPQDRCGRPPCAVCRADHRRRERHAFSTETTRPRANRSRAALLVPRQEGQWPSRSRCSWGDEGGSAMRRGSRARVACSLASPSDSTIARLTSPRSWDGRAAMTPSAGHPPSRWLQFPPIPAWMANAVLGSRSVVITAGASPEFRSS